MDQEPAKEVNSFLSVRQSSPVTSTVQQPVRRLHWQQATDAAAVSIGVALQVQAMEVGPRQNRSTRKGCRAEGGRLVIGAVPGSAGRGHEGGRISAASHRRRGSRERNAAR